MISKLAREYGVARQLLYRLRDRTRLALAAELAPRRPWPAPCRGAAAGGPDAGRADGADAASGGWCGGAGDLHLPGGKCWGCGAAWPGYRVCWWRRPSGRGRCGRRLAGPLLALADEIYAGHRPVLAVVDHASGLVAALEPAAVASAAAWGGVGLDLAARGVPVAEVAADGAHGLAAGTRAAGFGPPRLDHGHALRDLTRITKRLEGEAYRRLEAAERAERAATEAQRAATGEPRRVGRPLKAPADAAGVAATARAAAEAVQRADGAALVRELGGRSVPAGCRPGAGGCAPPPRRWPTCRPRRTCCSKWGGRAAAAGGPLQRHAHGLAAYLETRGLRWPGRARAGGRQP